MPGTPRTLVAVLGASNVTLALPQILRILEGRLGAQRTDYFVAHGPGRSYGAVAGLPIVGLKFTALNLCGLHDALEARWQSADRPPVYALLTDIGNDVLYGASVESIIGWVGEIVARLQPLGARIVITSLPVESVLRISAWKYRLVKTVLFPFRSMPRRDVFTRVVQLQDALEVLGRKMEVPVLPTRTEWYSFDRIHLARRGRHRAFTTWVDALLGDSASIPVSDPAPPAVRSPAGDGPPHAENGAPLTVSPLRLRFYRPAELYCAGRRRTREQTGIQVAPAARLYLY